MWRFFTNYRLRGSKPQGGSAAGGEERALASRANDGAEAIEIGQMTFEQKLIFLKKLGIRIDGEIESHARILAVNIEISSSNGVYRHCRNILSSGVKSLLDGVKRNSMVELLAGITNAAVEAYMKEEDKASPRAKACEKLLYSLIFSGHAPAATSFGDLIKGDNLKKACTLYFVGALMAQTFDPVNVLHGARLIVETNEESDSLNKASGGVPIAITLLEHLLKASSATTQQKGDACTYLMKLYLLKSMTFYNRLGSIADQLQIQEASATSLVSMSDTGSLILTLAELDESTQLIVEELRASLEAAVFWSQQWSHILNNNDSLLLTLQNFQQNVFGEVGGKYYHPGLEAFMCVLILKIDINAKLMGGEKTVAHRLGELKSGIFSANSRLRLMA